LAGVRGEIDYQAQAAIELEMLAPDAAPPLEAEPYPFTITGNGGVRIVKLAELLSAVTQDIRSQLPVEIISLKFHNTVARIITGMCRLIAEQTGITQVALSGGVFQNRLLLRLTTSALKKEAFSVLTHHLVPCNDGGISLGQAVIANFC